MTVVVVSSQVLKAAGGRLDPAFWLAMQELSTELNWPLTPRYIPHLINEGRVRRQNNMDAARMMRDKAAALEAEARALENQYVLFEQPVKKKAVSSIKVRRRKS